MGGNKIKRTYRGCKCGCGCGTWSTYAPGHDARHVAAQVAFVTAKWNSGAEAEIQWERALRNLPTEALRSKFRRSAMAKASKQLASDVKAMQDAEWQRVIRLDLMVTAIDPAFRGSHPETVAEVAAAMGMTRRSVNYRRS